jgi:protein disulfide-isomerase A6
MYRYLLVVLGLVALCTPAYPKKGVVELDDETFDKVMSGRSNHVVVAFQEYGWKEPDDFDKVHHEFSNVLVAKVSGHDSPKLKERFDIKTFPTIKFFPRGHADPVDVSGTTYSEVIDFVRAQLNPKLQELKKLANDFMGSTEHSKRQEIAAKAEQLVASFEATSKEYANLFVTFFNKIVDKGEEFVEKESARLKGLIDSKSTIPAKREEFQRRVNILKSFAKPVA